MIHLSFYSTHYNVAIGGDGSVYNLGQIRDFDDSVEVHEINKLLWGMGNIKYVAYQHDFKRIHLHILMIFFVLQRRIKRRF